MDALGISVPGIIAQIVNFTLLLILLRLFAYKPILRMLDQRSARIRESMDQAERIKEETARMEQEIQRRLDEARREGQAIVAQAAQVGERLQETARQEARQEGEGLLARARSEIQLERDQAIAELRQEFADLTIRAAEKVIRQSLDANAHQQLIDDTLREGLRPEEHRN